MIGEQLCESRRERKKRATRDALHGAALRLAAARGMANVTIEDITDAADVAPRTFFNYFHTKEDAILSWDPERPAHLAARLAARPTIEAPLEALRAVLSEGLIDEVTPAPAQVLEGFRLMRAEPALRAAVAARCAEAEQTLVAALLAREGEAADFELRLTLLVSAALSAYRVALIERSMRTADETVDEVLGKVFGTLADGFSRTLGELA